MVEYPESVVWYIEARPWNGPRGAGQLPGFAQVDPVRRGTGVVITLTRPVSDGTRQPRTYILTCSHVVRDGEDRLLEDIVCYPPGTGFVRTGENARRCGTFPHAEAQPAKVSRFSPCAGTIGPRPLDLKASAADDWVLLEIEDPEFYHRPSVRQLAVDPSKSGPFEVVGYPFGAGTIAEKQEAEQSGREYPFWSNGELILPRRFPDFRSAPISVPGMLDYEGPEETRPGMSGGGIFDQSGKLVGIHRSSTDATMKRGAIRADAIARCLRDKYGMELSFGYGIVPSYPGLIGWLWRGGAIGTVIIFAILLPNVTATITQDIELVFLPDHPKKEGHEVSLLDPNRRTIARRTSDSEGRIEFRIPWAYQDSKLTASILDDEELENCTLTFQPMAESVIFVVKLRKPAQSKK